PTFVLTPLTYLGGVFYSISLLPDFWQSVSHFNPVFYMINAFRYGFLGIADVSLVWSFSVIGAFIAVLYSVVAILLSKGIGTRS
ncbi:MAG: ABC transporter permease, partial [Psychromonas sp.]|nr:ABC transporter permease [Psychromonas sp.]